MTIALRACMLLAVVLAGCDDSGKNTQKQEQDAAAKAQQAEADAKKQSAALAERKAKRDAEFAAKQEADGKVAGELERLCVAPDKLPKKVPGCEEVGEARDAFVRRVSSPEEIAAWEGGGKEEAILMTVVQCTQADTPKVALCQKSALDGAGPALKDHAKELLQTCIDKYGKGAAAATAAVPKKRPG
jgi:hypothetical protein